MALIKSELPILGHDPMDAFSLSAQAEPTDLATIYWFLAREKPEKPGRSLVVEHDDRVPRAPDFDPRYIYTVAFTEIGNYAGNHFHRQKQELMRPVIGAVRVELEDVNTKQRETIRLEDRPPRVLHVRPGVAHTVVAETNPAVLLVLATYPNNEEDEFPYKVV